MNNMLATFLLIFFSIKCSIALEMYTYQYEEFDPNSWEVLNTNDIAK